MNQRTSRSSRGARLLGSLLVVSAIGLATATSASAQTIEPGPAESVAPEAQHAPGKQAPRGVTVDEARAAVEAIARPARIGGTAVAPDGSTLAAATSGGIVAVFIAPAHELAVIGTAQNDTIVVSRNAAGKLLVNGGSVPILGGTPTVGNTALIDVFGLDGNDIISLDEANGALPNADLFGGAGNDTLTGGSGADELFGESGNDTLLGKAGNDFLFGGSGDDILTGGSGDDQVFGESGNDRLIWNPGDGTDLNEGGDGIDTVEVNGGNAAETFTVVPNRTRVRFDRTTPAPFSLDIGTTENLVVNMNGGDDTFTASNGLASLIKLTVDGGPGNDRITGGDGDDRLIGGDGNDTIIGGRGSDTMLGGAGADVFVWNPGDGSDVVEGQAGADTLVFNGSNAGEKFDLSPSGSRLRLFRDVGSVTMDVDGVEHVSVIELGGADQTTINDLTGTAVSTIDLNLASSDGALDSVVVNATNANDAVKLSGGAGSVTLDGTTTKITITGAETTDTLLVNGLGGDDVLDGSAVGTGAIALTLDGGDGDDVVLGGAGNDVLLGGAGDNVLIGGPGQDVLDGGTGDNILIQ